MLESASRGGGVCLLPGGGGCLLWGGLLRGVSAPGGGVCSPGRDGLLQGWYPSMHWGRHPPPWTESQTPVKTLPWPNFVAAGKNHCIWFVTQVEIFEAPLYTIIVEYPQFQQNFYFCAGFGWCKTSWQQTLAVSPGVPSPGKNLVPQSRKLSNSLSQWCQCVMSLEYQSSGSEITYNERTEPGI